MIVGRMKGESDRAWDAFQVYLSLSLEERSPSEISARLGEPARRVTRWVERFDWNARAIAHARQVEEAERIERIIRLERKADEFRIGLIEPYDRAIARYEAIIERGEPQDSAAVIVALAEIMAAVPLVEQALLLTGKAEYAEAVVQSRINRAAIVRADLMNTIAGPGPGDAGAN